MAEQISFYFDQLI